MSIDRLGDDCWLRAREGWEEEERLEEAMVREEAAAEVRREGLREWRGEEGRGGWMVELEVELERVEGDGIEVLEGWWGWWEAG